MTLALFIKTVAVIFIAFIAVVAWVCRSAGEDVEKGMSDE